MPRPGAFTDTTASLSGGVFSALVRKARGRVVAPLHVGDIWRDPIPEARAEMQRMADRPRLHRYAPVHGVPELLDAFVAKVARSSGERLDTEAVQVTTGATGGFAAAAQALLSPGDEVLLPAPYWPLIRGIIASRGARAVEVPVMHRVAAAKAGETTLDLARELESRVTDRTVALYLNTPHNPTGAVLSEAMIDAAASVAETHNLWVLCDEAYEDLWLGTTRPKPAWLHPKIRPRAVVCHTMSKAYGLSGARIGFVHGPEETVARIRAVQTFHYYSAPTPMQFAAAEALAKGDTFLEQSRSLYRDAAAKSAGVVGAPVPEGGTFLFVDMSPFFRRGERDALALLERALDAGVLLTPGESCGREFSRFLRLCFTSLPPDGLASALARLQDALHT